MSENFGGHGVSRDESAAERPLATMGNALGQWLISEGWRAVSSRYDAGETRWEPHVGGRWPRPPYRVTWDGNRAVYTGLDTLGHVTELAVFAPLTADTFDRVRRYIADATAPEIEP